MEVLLDDGFNINNVSQEVLVAWPLILPVIYNWVTTLVTVPTPQKKREYAES